MRPNTEAPTNWLKPCMTMNNDATKYSRVCSGEGAEEDGREQKLYRKYCFFKCNSESLLLPCCVSKSSLWQPVVERIIRQPYFDIQSSLILLKQRLWVWGWNKTFLLHHLSPTKLEMEEREDALSQHDKIAMTELDPQSQFCALLSSHTKNGKRRIFIIVKKNTWT